MYYFGMMTQLFQSYTKAFYLHYECEVANFSQKWPLANLGQSREYLPKRLANVGKSGA
jgi:hypothetical protein